jgi:CheY-like chemotaxis protein/anti-sigma regulatory factor (Ser/Thr protein kinase)
VADRDRVVQVLLNLLSNAVKFTESGEVAVYVSAAPVDGGRLEMCIRIRDTGIGIPAHLHQRLFSRFTQLDAGATRQYGGAGLGLAISERLSRLLGGSLRVESAAGQGATFAFTFLASGVPRSGDASSRPFDGLRVLAHVPPGIVADQLRCTLSQWGAAVTFAAGNSAIDVASGPCDVQVIDADVANELPQHVEAAIDAPRVPTIVLTRVRGAAQSGAPRLHDIAKPVRRRALEEALRAATHAPATPAAAPLAAPLPARALAILLVEDNRANRRVLQLMLEELGLHADEAENGTEAVARARTREYDLILMDLQMPGLDGLEATRQIRALEPRKRPVIVALTANAVRGEERRCREAGMDGYMPKPLRLDTLAAALSALAAEPPCAI